MEIVQINILSDWRTIMGDFQYTTVQECESKIANMRKCIQRIEIESMIQFPLVEDRDRQFKHYPLHDIELYLERLKNAIGKLEEELERYKSKGY